jgi:hypothetical protein
MVESAQKHELIPEYGSVVLTAGHPIFQISSTNIIKIQFLG